MTAGCELAYIWKTRRLESGAQNTSKNSAIYQEKMSATFLQTVRTEIKAKLVEIKHGENSLSMEQLQYSSKKDDEARRHAARNWEERN